MFKIRGFYFSGVKNNAEASVKPIKARLGFLVFFGWFEHDALTAADAGADTTKKCA